jgi:hypothetical protein
LNHYQKMILFSLFILPAIVQGVVITESIFFDKTCVPQNVSTADECFDTVSKIKLKEFGKQFGAVEPNSKFQAEVEIIQILQYHFGLFKL